tara:strand:+ start:308 stop:583 length:276 start_codon:yes stop_codon:yes gene_type:complete
MTEKADHLLILPHDGRTIGRRQGGGHGKFAPERHPAIIQAGAAGIQKLTHPVEHQDNAGFSNDCNCLSGGRWNDILEVVGAEGIEPPTSAM